MLLLVCLTLHKQLLIVYYCMFDIQIILLLFQAYWVYYVLHIHMILMGTYLSYIYIF